MLDLPIERRHRLDANPNGVSHASRVVIDEGYRVFHRQVSAAGGTFSALGSENSFDVSQNFTRGRLNDINIHR